MTDFLLQINWFTDSEKVLLLFDKKIIVWLGLLQKWIKSFKKYVISLKQYNNAVKATPIRSTLGLVAAVKKYFENIF
jgi:hypothetical protein